MEGLNIEPNSNKYKNSSNLNRENKQLINRDDVIIHNKSSVNKAISDFIGMEVKDALINVMEKVVIPGVKNAILDSLSILFFNKKSSRNSNGERSYFSYGSVYKSEPKYNRRQTYNSRGSNYNNIIVLRRDKAESLVDELRYNIQTRGFATVSSLLEAVGETSSFTDNDWGWTKVNSIGIKVVNEGYLIDVEEPVYLR